MTILPTLMLRDFPETAAGHMALEFLSLPLPKLMQPLPRRLTKAARLR